MKELEVVQVRKRKTAEQPMEQPVKKPDAYDKVVEKAFWFVIGFSIALMVCCVAFGQTYIQKECHSEAATSQALSSKTN